MIVLKSELGADRLEAVVLRGLSPRVSLYCAGTVAPQGMTLKQWDVLDHEVRSLLSAAEAAACAAWPPRGA